VLHRKQCCIPVDLELPFIGTFEIGICYGGVAMKRIFGKSSVFSVLFSPIVDSYLAGNTLCRNISILSLCFAKCT